MGERWASLSAYPRAGLADMPRAPVSVCPGAAYGAGSMRPTRSGEAGLRRGEDREERAGHRVTLSHGYIPDRFLPEKAIDLVDEACATNRTGDADAAAPAREQGLNGRLNHARRAAHSAQLRAPERVPAAAAASAPRELRPAGGLVAEADDVTFSEVGEARRSPSSSTCWCRGAGGAAGEPGPGGGGATLAGRAKLVKVNVDSSPKIEERFGVRAIRR